MFRIKLYLSNFNPAPWKLIVGEMLTRMRKSVRKVWQFSDGAGFHLRFLFEILPVNGSQVMRPFICDQLLRFIVFGCLWLFLIEIVAISSIRIESISFGVHDVFSSIFVVGIWLFLEELWAVGCRRIKRLAVGVELVIFDEDFSPRYTFGSKLFEILRSWIEGNLFLLVLHSRDDFLTHLWFVAWKMLSIGGVDIVVRAVRLSLCIRKALLSAGGFCQVLMGC